MSLFLGKNTIALASVDSTNRYAQELLATKPVEGTLIFTERQSAGRGQMGTTWHSEEGASLTMSLILYPTFLGILDQFGLNMAIALGIRDGLSKMLPNLAFKIKWPNDIYTGDQKLGGILIENNVLGAGEISSTVVGIGLNVNQRSFPKELAKATSLAIQTDSIHETMELIPILCEHLEYRYLQLRAGDKIAIRSDFLNHLYRYQERHWFREEQTGEVFEGQILGVSPIGQLAIEHKGKLRYFSLKEVGFV